jgi:predicted ATPase
MKLLEIRLSNFKCFKAVNVNCSRFTLLTGANSSGKSSILYGLLGAIQTKDFPLYYSPNGSYVSMGDFEELAYDHSTKHPFEIGLTLSANDDRRYVVDCSYGENPETKLPKLNSLNYLSPAFSMKIAKGKNDYSAKFRFEPEKLANWEFSGSPEFKQAMLGFLKVMESKASKRTAKQKSQKSEPVEVLVERMFKVERAGSFSFKNSEELNNQRLQRVFLHDQVGGMTSFLKQFEGEFNFVSSFRLPPERTYYQKTKAALKVDKYGDNAIDQILEWEHAKSKKIVEMKKALRSLELASELKTKKYAGGRFDIRVVPRDSKLPSSLCDVGFGVSQFLPILVADLQLGKRSTLAVSQPEIHLHPSVQANLANHFCEQALAHEKRYVLETHSEYLINRFRLLVANGKLKEEDVSVIYLEWKGGKPTVHRIHFKKNGQIIGAPKQFFATYMMDVMKIAMNA